MSNIKIGEIIKNLRSEQNKKQDELAEYLNVTTQAISKWENGNSYPDITLIPQIAKFFSISIETLFTCSLEMADHLYQENCIAQNNYLEVGNIDMAVSLWKEAYIKYPSDYRVLKEYINAMCLCRNRQYTDKIIDSALCIFRNCKDDVIVQSTEFILKAYLYNEYDLRHARKIKYNEAQQEQDKELLNQYQTDEIFNKYRVYRNAAIAANEELKILIVDDVPFMRNILKEVLQNERECVISEACNGYEAIKAVEHSKPNIVVLDINMPEMDGIQALKQIRKMCPLIKIVMCSAMSYEATVKETAELGADIFIVKPFHKETILKAVIEK